MAGANYVYNSCFSRRNLDLFDLQAHIYIRVYMYIDKNEQNITELERRRGRRAIIFLSKENKLPPNYFDNYLPIHYLIHLPMLLPTQNRPSSIGALHVCTSRCRASLRLLTNCKAGSLPLRRCSTLGCDQISPS